MRRQWPGYINEIMRVLKPGGWVQCTEFRGHQLYAEGNVPEDSAIREVFIPILFDYPLLTKIIV